MNMIHMAIGNTCRIEIFAEYNHFNYEQKQILLKLLFDFEATHQSNILKLTRNLKKFEDKFKEYNGNHNKLEESVKTIRDEAYIQAAKAAGLKISKDGKQI